MEMFFWACGSGVLELQTKLWASAHSAVIAEDRITRDFAGCPVLRLCFESGAWVQSLVPRHVGTKIPRAKGHRLDHFKKKKKKRKKKILGIPRRSSGQDLALSLPRFNHWLGNKDPHKPCGVAELKRKKKTRNLFSI